MKKSPAKAQRRKALPRFERIYRAFLGVFLCAFAPLRETLPKPI